MTIPPVTQLELFSHGLKSIKVNFSNIPEPLWSVLETRIRNKFPSPASLKQVEDALQEERYEILLETVQNLYESIPRRNAALLKAKRGRRPY
jgi:hypothetical protein